MFRSALSSVARTAAQARTAVWRPPHDISTASRSRAPAAPVRAQPVGSPRQAPDDAEVVPEYGEWKRPSRQPRRPQPINPSHPLYVSTPDASNLPRQAEEAAALVGRMASPPYNVLFFGMDSMSLPTLEALVNDFRRASPNSCVRNLEVVRPHSLRKGFEVPKGLLDGVKVHTAPKGSLKGWKAPLTAEGKPFDLAVVVSFGYFLPSKLIESFPLGVINMHPSMLPKYRGASPVATALMNGDSSSGVSIVAIRPREVMDSGCILTSRATMLDSRWTYAEAEECLGNLGAQAMLHAIKDYPRLLPVAAEQPESEATLTAKIDANTRGLKFTKQTSTQVYNLWRSLTEFGFPYAMFRDCDGKDHRMVFRNVELASAVFDALRPTRARDAKTKQSQQQRSDGTDRRAEAQTRIVEELNLLAPIAPPGSIYFARHSGTHNVAFVRCATSVEGGNGPRRNQLIMNRNQNAKGLNSVDKAWIAVRELSVQGRGVLPPERWRQWAKMEAGELYTPEGQKGNYFVDAPQEKEK